MIAALQQAFGGFVCRPRQSDRSRRSRGSDPSDARSRCTCSRHAKTVLSHDVPISGFGFNRLGRAAFLPLILLIAGCSFGPPLPDDARRLDDVSYIERETGNLAGRLFLPAQNGPRPAVLLLHGGGWRNGSPRQMDVIARRLVSQGFVVFSAAYRLAPGTRYPGQLEDARAALAWLADRPEVDPRRMAAWGYSAGAQLALLLALNPAPGQPRPLAVVAGGAPAALGLFDGKSRLLVDYLGAPRSEAPGTWLEASPIEWVSQDDPSAFLYHGQTDRLVDIRHARLLARRLREAGVKVILDEVPGGHVGVFLTGRAIEARATAFLAEQLGG